MIEHLRGEREHWNRLAGRAGRRSGSRLFVCTAASSRGRSSVSILIAGATGQPVSFRHCLTGERRSSGVTL